MVPFWMSGTIQRSGPDVCSIPVVAGCQVKVKPDGSGKRGSMTGAGPAVEGDAACGDEFPLIAVGEQRQLQNAVLSCDLLLAVWPARDELVIGVHAASAHDELTDATCGIGTAIASLWSKPFVKMIV